MSISTSTISSASVDRVNEVNILIARCFYPVIFFFGIVCNLLNIFVFTRSDLNRNPCCMYFLSSSIAALVFTIINLPLRTLQIGYSIDPSTDILIFCKLRYYFTFTWRGLTTWFLVLACIDRFLHSSTNANLRKLSSQKVAIRTIPITFVVCHLVYLNVPIFYDIPTSRRTCTVPSGFQSTFLTTWHLITYGTGPPLIVLIFSLLTIRHIRRRQILPFLEQTNVAGRISNKDRNFLRMVLVQCLVIGLTNTAYALGVWYSTFSSSQTKDRLQLAIDSLLVNILGSISAAGHSTTFFIYTLTSKLFRQQLRCRHG